MDLNRMKMKARSAAGQHGDKLKQGLDKMAEVAKKRAGGKHSSKIDQAAERGKDAVDALGRDGSRR